MSSNEVEDTILTEEEYTTIEFALSSMIGDSDANQLITKIAGAMSAAHYYKMMYERTKDRLRRAREVLGSK